MLNWLSYSLSCCHVLLYMKRLQFSLWNTLKRVLTAYSYDVILYTVTKPQSYIIYLDLERLNECQTSRNGSGFFFLSRCWVGNILWDLLTSLLFRLWKWCFTARRLFFNQGLRRVPWRVLEPFMVEHGVDAAWYNQSPSVIQCPGSLVTALGLKAAHKVCEHSAIYLSLWACARTHLTFSISSAWQIVPP